MSTKNKKKALFVGSFKSAAADGSVGGLMFACTTLINSRISEDVDWVLLDSTAPTNMKRSLLARLGSASSRVASFMNALTFKKPEFVIVFSSNGFSFLEKGVMVMLADLYGTPGHLRPKGWPSHGGAFE